MMDTGNNNQQIKFLFARLREQHEQQQRRERRDKLLMAESTTTADLESEADEDSASPIKNTTKSCAQSSFTDEKPSETKALDNEVQPSPSQISLPFITFKEEDDCDEAEKLARAKRIEVIMKLSAEAKAKEAERRRVANIRPLSWKKPTFDYPSFSTSNSSTTAAAASDPNPNEAPQASSTLGKRKARQEQEESSRRSYPTFPTSRSYPIPRQATEEEIQALVDFADTWFPPNPSKRRSTEKGGDDK
mmetsp:Transcript_25805/g.43832  ORF Transcript_25805/g.43832 Transcript_25805/m.43832 type:complete len:247 (-) Transcript_25805:91-831(-)